MIPLLLNKRKEMGLPEISAKLNTVDFAQSHSLVKGNLKLHLTVRFQLSWE
ncbi:MAG: hypothetical protein RL222_1613 [Bacteroidota bacterium]|jgi:hypothetical protein